MAMMSIWPRHAQASAMRKNAISVAPIARPAGDAGVAMISSAAGRNSRSSRRGGAARRSRITLPEGVSVGAGASAGFMEPRLHAMQRGIASAAADQFVVVAVLDDAAALDGDNAVGLAHRGETMRDDDDGAPL